MAANAFRRLFRGETSFDFAGRWRRWFVISGSVIVIGFISLGVSGLNFSIDFRGGTQWEVPSNASVAQTRAVLGNISGLLSQSQIQTLRNPQTHQQTIKVEAAAKLTSNSTEVARVTDALANLAHVSSNTVQLNDIGPSWGSDITNKAVRAVIIFLIVVSAYIWLRFEAKMALAALVALVHDILVTVGIYSLSGFQVSPDTVIAFLTILGYSLYDTIVVFDRVQENTKGLASTGRVTYTDTVNLSMNQVLARSLNTSLVAIIPILSILVIGAWILGATALEDFGLALFIGLTTGAYSSIFIASPLVALLKEREPRYAQIRQRLSGRATGRLTPAAAAQGRLEGDPLRMQPTPVGGRGWARRRQAWLEADPDSGAGTTAAPGEDAAGSGATGTTGRTAGGGGNGATDGEREEVTDGAASTRPANGASPAGGARPSDLAATRPPGVPPRGTRPPPRPRKKRRR